MRTSNITCRTSDFERLAREAAAVVRREFNAKEFARLGDLRTWFDLPAAAAYLAVSEPTLSRCIKERTAPPSAKVGNDLRFTEMIRTPGLAPVALSLSRRRRISIPIERKIIRLEDAARVPELDSVTGCDFDIARNLEAQEHLRRSPSLCGRRLCRWAIVPERRK
jgi:hypothetical protein